MRPECGRCIEAVLTTDQLGRFCKRFGTNPGAISVDLSGPEKYVLLSSDSAFLFPRDPRCARSLRRELAVYEAFSNLRSPILPKLIARLRDPAISFYEFGIVTRMFGVTLSEIARDIDSRQLEKILLELARSIVEWHSIPLASLSSSIARVEPAPNRGKVIWRNWHRKALTLCTVGEATRFAQRLIMRRAEQLRLDCSEICSSETAIKWERVLRQLAGLRRVLVHADLHDDHIVLGPSRGPSITGILDWGSSRIDNPIWDFSFDGWGPWIRNWTGRFGAFRSGMWREYVRGRKIGNVSINAPHLFFTLMQIVSSTRVRDGVEPYSAGNDSPESLNAGILSLCELTSSL